MKNEPTKPKLAANRPKSYGSPDGYTTHTPGDVPETPSMNVPARPGTTDGYVTPPVTFDDAD